MPEHIITFFETSDKKERLGGRDPLRPEESALLGKGMF